LPPTFKKDKKKILQALEESDMVFIIAGLGGGTGTFWGPVIAEVCNELGIFTIAVMTEPLINGPSQPQRWAQKGIEKLTAHADTVIKFYLNKDFESTLFPENNLREVYALAQKKILEAVKEITGLILFPGLISLDLKDIKSLCHKKGLGAFQVGIAKGPGRVRKAVQMAISELSYRGDRLAYFQQILLGVTGGPNLGFEEVIEAVELVRKEMDDQATIIWGTATDESIGEEFRIMIFASGRKYEKPCWANNIFYQVENKNLKLELERLSRERNWTLREGGAFTPDLVAIPYFISIVDRSLIGEECWNVFLEFCRESRDDTPLIIVDNLRHLKLPDHKNITFVDLNNPQSFEEIKSIIRKIGV
jgi:cell division GTPase FtsZ